MNTPDFEALRAKRNAAVQAEFQRVADEWGVPLQSLRSTFNPASCYCNCVEDGPCEHEWDGEPYESDGLWTTTCSRCGTTSFSHSMRTAP